VHDFRCTAGAPVWCSITLTKAGSRGCRRGAPVGRPIAMVAKSITAGDSLITPMPLSPEPAAMPAAISHNGSRSTTPAAPSARPCQTHQLHLQHPTAYPILIWAAQLPIKETHLSSHPSKGRPTLDPWQPEKKPKISKNGIGGQQTQIVRGKEGHTTGSVTSSYSPAMARRRSSDPT
ncbi:hypothetical protein ACLOJK_006764, partial [Asimina triloba]